jgi:hypothetical protein
MNSDRFLSPQGFPPRVWGPLCWKFSHIVTANYPLKPSARDVELYHAYFKSLCRILPCRACRQEFCKVVQSSTSPLRLTKALLRQKPTDPPGTARQRLFTWFVRVHARVNTRLKKGYPRDPQFWASVYASKRKA